MNTKHIDDKLLPCEMCQYAALTDIYYCKQCAQQFCSSCVKLHNNMRLATGHYINKVNAQNLEYAYALTEEDIHSKVRVGRSKDLRRGLENQKELDKPGQRGKLTHEVGNMHDKSAESKKTLTGIRFTVFIQATPTSIKSGIVGERILVVETGKLNIQDKDIEVPIVEIPFPWIRRYGCRGKGVFYVEVGRRFAFGEGYINMLSHQSIQIDEIVSSKNKTEMQKKI